MKTNNINKIVVFDNKELDMVAWCKKLFFKSLKVVYLQQMQIGINKKDLLHTFRFSAIDKWLAPLPYLKKEIGIRTKFPLNKVEIVPLCLDIEPFLKNPYSQAEARENMGIVTDKPLLGILGRISEKKGQQFLVECLENMVDKGLELELVIFGSPTVNDPECQAYHKAMLDYIELRQLSSHIHLIPYQKDVAQFYAAIDLFIMASHSETVGMVTVEAMLSEKPIIGTNSGGTPELLENGEVGTLYEYNNHESLIEKVLLYLENVDEFQAKGKQAKKLPQKSTTTTFG